MVLSELEIRDIQNALMLSAGADWNAAKDLESSGNRITELKRAAHEALMRDATRKLKLAERLIDSLSRSQGRHDPSK